MKLSSWLFVLGALSSSVSNGSPVREIASYTNFADVPCGKVNMMEKIPGNRTARIVNGNDAFPGEYPWSASILAENGLHHCGGFAISRRYILTAAHCFTLYIHGVIGDETIQKMTVVLGITNLTQYGLHGFQTNANLLEVRPRDDSQGLIAAGQKIRIKRVVSHKEFTQLYPDFENDIALIELEDDIQWNRLVQPVCVSTLNMRDHGDMNASVAGWGLHSEQQSDDEWKYKVTLKKINQMPVWKNMECKRAYQELGKNWNTRESHVCAGYHDGRADACRGDSGSALTVEQKEPGNHLVYVAIGLDSGGEGCSKPGVPGVYTRVSHFIQWIKTSIEQLNKGT